MRTFLIVCLVVVAVAATTVSAQCKTPLVEPPAVTKSDPLLDTDGDGDSIYVMTYNMSEAFDRVYIRFGDAENYCTFDSYNIPTGSNYTNITAVDDCFEQWTFSIKIRDMLDNCGFEQDLVREPQTTHFIQTVNIFTEQEREDLRDDRNVTRLTQFIIDLRFPSNVTASTNPLFFDIPAYADQEIIVLNVLGDLVINIEDTGSSYDYSVNGTVVTALPFPFIISELLNSNASFPLSEQDLIWSVDQYCPDNSEGLYCLQKFSFFTEIVADCSNTSALDDAIIFMQLQVNCSASYDGECADFEVDPVINITFSTPRYCPSTSFLALENDLTIYAYSGANSGIAAPVDGWTGDATSGIPADFVEEAVFTYESTAYGEMSVAVGQGGATIATTTILSIKTRPTGVPDNELELYARYNGQTITTQETSTVVADAGFGTGDYSNDRSRFQFEWSNTTFDRVDSERDVSEGAEITVLIEVTFDEGAEAVESFKGASSYGLLRTLAQRIKSFRATEVSESPVSLAEAFSSGSDPQQAFARDTVTIGTNVANPNTGASSSSDDGFLGLSQSSGLAVGGVACVALVVAAAIYRSKRSAATEEDSSTDKIRTLPETSSAQDIQLASLPVIMPNADGTFSTDINTLNTMPMNTLQSTAE
jgi:hypothetical protein